MKVLRLLSWLVAALPLVAAGFWASFAARLPEAVGDRQALLEVTPRWDWASWSDVGSEPMHVLARALHLAALHIPGATMASVVWLNVLFALSIVVALCDVCRRAFPALAGAGPVMFGIFGLLVATPAFGANWLHGERLGVFAVVALFLHALVWLQGERRFAGRALLAMLAAGLAPWFHVHGIVVAIALIPSLLCSAAAAGSQRRTVWALALLVLGGVAAFFSLRTDPGLAAAAADCLAAIMSAPGEVAMNVLYATGDAWLNVWPDSSLDELVLGAATWLSPMLLLWLGDRSVKARAAAAPWWGCLLFGLLLVVVNAARYQLQPPVGTLREAMFGSFLLPIGLIGVLAARFGLLTFGLLAGGIAVLAMQDWHRGIEDLRLAHMRGEQVEASVIMPAVGIEGTRPLPVRDADELALLAKRAWVPDIVAMSDSDVVAAFDKPSKSSVGGIKGGSTVGDSTTKVHGTLRSSLRIETPQWIAVVAKQGADPARIAAHLVPRYVGRSRTITWQVELPQALPDGTRVRLIALMVRGRELVPLGPTFAMQAGELVVQGAP